MRRGPAPAPQAFAPPMAARPAGPGRARTIGGFALLVGSAHQENVLIIDPSNQQVAVHPKTWAWAQNHQTVLGMFVHEKAEAVRLMKVRMQYVSGYAPAADPNRKIAPVPMGITMLCRDLAQLVGEMSSLDPADAAEVRKMAVRYGRMRDTMATLRVAFTEAEGSFEIAQALLVQKMGLEDE